MLKKLTTPLSASQLLVYLVVTTKTQQASHLLALEPIAAIQADPQIHIDIRSKRSPHDARGQCFLAEISVVLPQ